MRHTRGRLLQVRGFLGRILSVCSSAETKPEGGIDVKVGRYDLPERSLARSSVSEHAAETMARSCFEQGFAWMQLEAIMNVLPEDSKLRWKQQANPNMAAPKSFINGASGHTMASPKI